MEQGFRLSPQQLALLKFKHVAESCYCLLGISSQISKETFENACENVCGQFEIFQTQFSKLAGFEQLLQVLTDYSFESYAVDVTFDSLIDMRDWLDAQRMEQSVKSGVRLFWLRTHDGNKYAALFFNGLALDEDATRLLITHITTAIEQGVEQTTDSIVDNLPYIEAAEWTNNLLSGEEGREGVRFWLDTQFLGHYTQTSQLEIGVGGTSSAKLGKAVHLDAALENVLAQYCDVAQIQPQVVFAAAWGLAVNQYQESDRIVLGMEVSGRTDAELATTMGPLSRDIPLVVDIKNSQSPAQLLQSLSQYLDDGLAFQECFSWQNFKSVGPEAAYFPYRVKFHHRSDSSSQSIDIIHIDTLSTPYMATMVVECNQTTRNHQIKVVYDPLRLDSDLLDLLCKQIPYIISQLVTKANLPLSEINLLPQAHADTALIAFNNTLVNFNTEEGIVARFDLQVLKTPEKIALVHNETSMTYTQVSQRVNSFATTLSEKNVKAGDFVGVCVPRSTDSVIAILAIWKVGGIYVPLDPSYPKERLAYIVADSKMSTIVASKPLSASFDDFTGSFIDPELVVVKSEEFTEKTSSKQAYLIYTSGSTGTPKGTLVSHAALLEHTLSVQLHYAISEQDRVLLFAPFNFDPSLEQSIPGLLSGATIIIREDDVWRTTDVANRIQSYGLTVVNFPTAYWHLLVNEWIQDASVHAKLSSLRLMICGGDKMLPEMVKRWCRLGLSHVRLLNAYGPTETTITATTAEIDSKTVAQLFKIVPIGRPLPNRKVYVLDQQLNCVPIGSEGELYIAGACLADGYLNLEEQTQLCFVKDPFEANSRMYKTGDRAYFDAHGNLFFAGRRDNQLKINGFRIELGEIECAILAHPNISEAVVVVKKSNDETLSNTLIAFYVGTGEIQPQQLKAILEGSIPRYMVPHELFNVASLPLLPNGKVDHKALLTLSEDLKNSILAYVPPQTGTEIILAKIWSEIFELENVSIKDNFFALGGHSLKAMKLISYINKAFNVELSLQHIFTSVDLQALAQVVDSLPKCNASSSPILFIKDVTSGPLSPSQERFWILDKLGLSTQYHMSGYQQIVGSFDIKVLQQAVEYLVIKHSILRTQITQVGNAAVQNILDFSPVVFDYVDLVRFEGSLKTDAINSYFKAWSSKNFDLSSPPLFRVSLAKIADSQHILGFCIHHIIADGISIGIILSELGAIYSQLIDGIPLTYSSDSVRYLDYSLWENQRLVESDLQKERAYWQAELGGYQDLSLPTDYPRPPRLSGLGENLYWTFPISLSEKLRILGQTKGISVFALLMSALYKVISVHSRQSDICFGVPVANREDASLQSVIGLFVNTLVVRISESEQESYQTLAGNVQKKLILAQEHQRLSFDKIVELLQPERDLSRNPLFQVLVSHIQPQVMPSFGDAVSERYELPFTNSRFDISFDFEETIDGLLSVVVEYSTDLFKASRIQRMCKHLEQALTALVSHFDSRIADVSIINATESQAIEHAEQGAHSLVDRTFLQNFKQHVVNSPDAVAVESTTEVLTYRELDVLSDSVAVSVQTYAGSGLVGVCMTREPKLLAALIGIWKAGAAYVPLDPDYPVERLRYITKDSGMDVVISDSVLSGFASSVASTQVKILNVDDVPQRVTPAQWEITPEGLAYVIYTSGTTGKPKGVRVHHQNVANFLHSMAIRPGMTQSDTLLSVTTYCFDISVLEFFLPLSVGARCYICASASTKNGEKLLEEIEFVNPTVVQATPSTWQMLFELGWNNPKRATLLCGGEALPDSLRKHFIACKSKVWNMYGPTETTVWSTLWEVSAQSKTLIGNPIHNTQIYILDKTGNRVPVGVCGEIFIGGAGVASGYWQNPEMTDSRFVDHKVFGCLYRTGDSGAWEDVDDTLQLSCHGRIDDQIKLRGYRIELGEIESQLVKIPHILQACVVLKEYENRPLLCSYLVTDAEVDLLQLRSTLSEYLPGFMVPSQFVFEDALPLTANGKVDRRALQVKKDRPGPFVDLHAELDTATERALAKLWQEILPGCEASPNDSFFQLGGHSILLVMLQGRIKEQFNLHVAIDLLFEHHVLRSLASYIDSQLHLSVRPDSCLVRHNAKEAPLSFSQQSLWLIDQVSGPNSTYNVPTAMRIKGKIDIAVLAECLNEVIYRHETLRTTFDFVNGQAVQIIRPFEPLDIAYSDLRGMPKLTQDAVVESIINTEFEYVFNLIEGPVLRSSIIILSDDELLLVLNVHHIATDGWSMRIIVEEMTALYHYFVNKMPNRLAPLMFNYSDFSIWQRQYIQSNEYAESLNYWKNYLQGAPLLSPIPRDFPYPDKQRNVGRILPIFLNKELTSKIRIQAQALNCTSFVLLLSVYKLLLAIESRQTDIVVGTDLANRNEPVLEKMIGFFVNQIALRTQISMDMSVKELIRTVQHELINGMKHSQVGFDQVVSTLNIQRDPRYSPVFQTKFFMEKISEEIYKNEPYKFEFIPIKRQPARLDMTLGLVEGEHEISGSIVFNEAIIRDSTVFRMLMRFNIILDFFVSNSEIKLCDLKQDLTKIENDQVKVERDLFEKGRLNSFKSNKPRKIISV